MQQFAQGESVKNLYGQPHLFRNGAVRVFANRTQAEAVAQRVGGQAYQSPFSSRFLVRLMGY